MLPIEHTLKMVQTKWIARLGAHVSAGFITRSFYVGSQHIQEALGLNLKLNCRIVLTLCPLVPSADNLCKQLDPEKD